jgi:Phosphotransferase enzyme family
VQALGKVALMLEALAGQIPAVPMIGAGRSSDGGQVLALEWVQGHLPGFRWTEHEIALVRSACEQVSQVPTAALSTLAPVHVADGMLDSVELLEALTDGLTLPYSLDLLPRWLPTRTDEVVALASDTDALGVENHLNHCDLRPDNLLIGRAAGKAGGPAYLLDWNWVTVGPPWCDWVALVPGMQAQGHDLPKLLDSTPLSRSAGPHLLTSGSPWWRSPCWPDARLSHHRAPRRPFAATALLRRDLPNTLASHRGWL